MARIEAGYAQAAVGELPGDIHLPNELWRSGLRDLLKMGDARRASVESDVEFYVAVGQNLGVAATDGVEGEQVVFPENVGGLIEFIDLENRDAAVAIGDRSSAHILVAIDETGIAVVEEHQ